MMTPSLWAAAQTAPEGLAARNVLQWLLGTAVILPFVIAAYRPLPIANGVEVAAVAAILAPAIAIPFARLTIPWQTTPRASYACAACLWAALTVAGIRAWLLLPPFHLALLWGFLVAYAWSQERAILAWHLTGTYPGLGLVRSLDPRVWQARPVPEALARIAATRLSKRSAPPEGAAEAWALIGVAPGSDPDAIEEAFRRAVEGVKARDLSAAARIEALATLARAKDGLTELGRPDAKDADVPDGLTLYLRGVSRKRAQLRELGVRLMVYQNPAALRLIASTDAEVWASVARQDPEVFRLLAGAPVQAGGGSAVAAIPSQERVRWLVAVFLLVGSWGVGLGDWRPSPVLAGPGARVATAATPKMTPIATPAPTPTPLPPVARAIVTTLDEGFGRITDGGLGGFSPDGSMALIRPNSGPGLRAWDLRRGRWEPARLPERASLVKFDHSGDLSAITTDAPATLEVRRRGRRLWSVGMNVQEMAFSANGDLLATLAQVDRNGMTVATRVEVRDAVSGKIRHRHIADKQLLMDVWIAPNGRQYATLGGKIEAGAGEVSQDTITFLDMASGRPVKRLPDTKSLVDDAAYSADGKTLFVSTARESGGYIYTEGRTALWAFDLASGRFGRDVIAFPEPAAGSMDSSPTSFAESPDGSALIVSRGERTQVIAMPSRRAVASWTNPGSKPDSSESYQCHFVSAREAIAAPSNLSSVSSARLLRIELK